jgi:hypothetical protein
MMFFGFFKRFGGPASTKQKLEDLGRNLPVWTQPVWKWFVEILAHWIERLKIAAEMAEVDKQVEQIDDLWTETEDRARLESAQVVAEEIKKSQPDAAIAVAEVPFGNGEKDVAIMIDHPKDGSEAQEKLGGAMEIRNPWVDR